MSSVTSLLINLSSQQSSASKWAAYTASTSKPAATPEAEASPTPATDTVTLSAQAQATVSPASQGSIKYYSQFFPVREGFSAASFATAVTNPGAEGSSAGKDFQTVATDARATINANYKQMSANGQPFNFNSREGKDWYTALSGLDRRSLNAVATNQGGLFSADEQDIAKSVMSQQMALGSGMYAGPTSQASKFTDTSKVNLAGSYGRMMQYLDNVSPEEKSSAAWMVNRAGLQRNYHQMTQDSTGHADTQYDSTDPLVKWFSEAMDKAMEKSADGYITSGGTIRNTTDLNQWPMFANGNNAALLAALTARQNQLKG